MEDNDYSKFQRSYYNKEAPQWTPTNRNPIVGSWSAQNSWIGYERDLWGKLDIGDKDKVALDWATGPGRNIAKFQHLFERIDGVDFSEVIEAAKRHLEAEGITNSNLFVTDGYDLKTPDLVPDNTYDFVFGTIAFQHIAVYDIRFSYLKEFYRVLKPGGWITIQAGHGGGMDYPVVGYYDNVYDAKATNGNLDVSITNTEDLRKDLEDKIGFVNFDYDIVPEGWGGMARNHKNWIYFRAQKPLGA